MSLRDVWQKLFDTFVWCNFPSTSSPVNAANLNKMNTAIDGIDDRVLELKTGLDGVTEDLEDKVDKEKGKGLSTNDFDNTYKDKLDGISEQANKVEITPVVTEGTTLATISIDGVDTDIKGSDIDVDNELKPDSTNPVQNKVIYETLQSILPEETAEGNPISISDASGLNAKSCEIAFSPIQSGSGDPSPENVRPISGWTELNLGLAGKNLVDWNVGKFSGGTGLVVTLLKGTYTLSQSVDVNTGNWYIRAQKSDSTYCTKDELGLSSFSYSSSIPGVYYGANNAHSITFTIPNNNVEVTVGTQTNPATETPAQLEVGSTRTAYQPFVKYSTISKSIGSTYYGGSYDFVSGKGRVTYGRVDLGNLTWNLHERYANTFYADISEKKVNDVNFMCEKYANGGKFSNYANIENLKMYASSSETYPRIVVKDTSYSTASDFKTSLSGVYLCYELATPQEITLTAEQIALLKGQNVLWTDGDNITLKYSADIKAYIDSQLNS